LIRAADCTVAAADGRNPAAAADAAISPAPGSMIIPILLER
jgi:hypothetical protein